VTEIRGGQFGDHNLQINLFAGETPRGPVVAGNVPQAPPAFQPREDLMAQLRSAGPGVSVVRAVTGMRGVGKTQLAAAYARECIDAGWRLVAWINAEDTATILNDLALVADRLGVRPGTIALEITGAAVRNRLEADGTRCLIVFDNVTDPDAVRPYVPSAGKSQVLITSTQASALTLGKLTQVGVFAEGESLDFLTERTGHHDPTAATTLAGELGHLPLALAQAAAVIAARHLTYPTYLDRLRSYPAHKYLPPVKGDPYPRGVAETILLSIDAVTATDSTGLCREVLSVISLLSAEGVSRDLLHRIESAGGAEAIDEALGRLADASLLTFSGAGESGEPTVIAHRLVTRVVRERTAREGTMTAVGATASAAVAVATRSLSLRWRDRRSAIRELVRHIVALNEHLAPYVRADDETLSKELLDGRGWAVSYLNALGDSPAEALELAAPLVDDRARMLGEDDPDTLLSRYDLAAAYDHAGRLGEAIPLYERTLADRVRVLGEAHRDTLISRSSLASAYHGAGRLGEAIPLYEQTLAAQLRTLGEDHPDTLMSWNNLASAYRAAGRVEEAISLLEQTLARRVRVLGEGHQDTLGSRNNLAFAYQEVGRLGEAIPLFEQTLDDSVRVLGEGHPDTLGSRNNLAFTYHAVGRVGEAIALFEQTLADSVRVLGEGHPDTLQTLGNLAVAYFVTGRTREAISMFEQAHAGLERVRGEEHPDTVAARGNLTTARREARRRGGNASA
jgi:tetratricopeptide (TPR) repeat protein